MINKMINMNLTELYYWDLKFTIVPKELSNLKILDCW